MNKTWIIIKREYLTRVRKKTFLLSTLLFPLLYVALIGGMGFIAENSKESLSIALFDDSGYFDAARLEQQNTADNSSVLTLVKDKTPAMLQPKDGYDGYVVIPQLDWKTGLDSINVNTYKSYGSATISAIEAKLNRIWRQVINDSLQIDPGKQQILTQSHVGLRAKNIVDEKSDSDTAEGIGYFAGFLMYFILIIYGSQVMMGVMEEKTNRIAEVIVSSVRPFQMMLGKILGIGAVALTQFLLWVLFIFIAYNVGKEAGTDMGIMAAIVGKTQTILTGVNVSLILFCFAFYFLAGFLFYASLYGAVGSAVNEDVREAQSLSFPITMLVIISIAMMTAATANPSGPIAVWGSLIPFSSPVVMMARIPYGVPGTVPWWQLLLSMGILVCSFLLMVGLAGKIYRTGILMYGKKITWAEMLKWAWRKN